MQWNVWWPKSGAGRSKIERERVGVDINRNALLFEKLAQVGCTVLLTNYEGAR